MVRRKGLKICQESIGIILRSWLSADLKHFFDKAQRDITRVKAGNLDFHLNFAEKTLRNSTHSTKLIILPDLWFLLHCYAGKKQ